MTRSLTEPGFSGFVDPARPKDLFYVSMTRYDKTFTWVPYVFGPQTVENILANVFAREGMKNLRVAETEKYAHVTYFFNGGVEKPYDGEERVLVPSPKVPTYDLKPEMSAEGIAADEAVDRCLAQIYAALKERGGAWIISADHGNAETMVNQDGSPHTYHTTNPVPFILISDDAKVRLRTDGALQDIAPTILGLMGIPQPSEMKVRDLRSS